MTTMLKQQNIRAWALMGALVVMFFLLTGFVYQQNVATGGFIAQRYKETITEPIAIETIREQDPNMDKGTEVLVQAGHTGLQRVTREVYLDGAKPIKQTVLESSVITPMQPRIVKEGTRENTIQTASGVMHYKEVITMHATAYTAAEGNGDGMTATGMRAVRGQVGIVAVDPAVIPLGTRLYIPGYGEAIAADTGGAIEGHRIDLLMNSYGEAINFGRQNVEVYVLQ